MFASAEKINGGTSWLNKGREAGTWTARITLVSRRMYGLEDRAPAESAAERVASWSYQSCAPPLPAPPPTRTRAHMRGPLQTRRHGAA
ncbi:hypothetical protein SKAU_G00402940 [Synaphobranchus kaupii]|uniref:Uncharacterized protein n=1 Tax=Synaphobranchus kaupii TaxID=118154 RepID=A0A9Q1E9G7_SYNKA|nr:hypothetical protein SKAU_G00402940 [Synaphobranchus kaupii]